MSKITPQWIQNHFREKDELENYRYKVKYRREELEEEKYGEPNYEEFLNQRLNHKGERSTPLSNRV